MASDREVVKTYQQKGEVILNGKEIEDKGD